MYVLIRFLSVEGFYMCMHILYFWSTFPHAWYLSYITIYLFQVSPTQQIRTCVLLYTNVVRLRNLRMATQLIRLR